MARSPEAKEARDKFKQADELYRAHKYPEALVVLDELDKEFPDVKNIIYPRAMCLARVERFDEALDLCRQLKVEFGDARGEKLMTKISAIRKAAKDLENQKKESKASAPAVPPPNVFTLDSNRAPGTEPAKKNLEFSPVFDPGTQGGASGATPGSDSVGATGLDSLDLGDGSPVVDMSALDDLFASKPVAPPAPKPQPKSNTWIFIVVGVAAALIAVLALLPFLSKRGSTVPAPPPASPATDAIAPQASAPEAEPELPTVPINWLMSYEEAIRATYEQDSPMLFVFYSGATSTADMEQLDRFVWSEPSIQNLVKDWICAKVDVDTDPDVKEMFELTTLPTVITTDYAQGEESFRKEGTFTATEFYDEFVANAPVSTDIDLPPLPASALLLMPILYAVATFSPVFLTLLILGRLPDEDHVTAFMTMFLVGIVSPFLGLLAMRVVYQLERAQIMIYYVLLSVHLFLFWLIMTFTIGMPFHIYLLALREGW